MSDEEETLSVAVPKNTNRRLVRSEESVDDDQPQAFENILSSRRKRKPAISDKDRYSGAIQTSSRPSSLVEIKEEEKKEPAMAQPKGLLQIKQQHYSKRLSLTPESKHKERPTLQNSHSVELGSLPTWRGKTYTTLQNYWTGEQQSDRLHHQGPQLKNSGCHNNHCVGSQIWPKDHPRSRPFGPPRPKEEMKEKAKEYLKQYFESQKGAIGPDYLIKLQARLEEVVQEIDKKGHYDLTNEELTYGARLAWRNAPRCVNRIVWRQLEMLDARDCNNPKEMFEAICHHLKYATNGGNIRSTITVFKHRTKAQSDFRVWNSQLIKYAGYKNNDGTFIGDPDSVEFTEICRRLGWSPPGNRPGMFQVLPVVLQAYGGQPELFEIPKDLILEVEITHPEYKWFADFGLRWYAVPAVSNIMLDLGGLEFTGCPFNGWYMSSEIGGRNLSDEYRYNMLKPVAEKMGLNTATYKLWKDKALVELNYAVLHSYQKANVSIVDHHTATEGFITFFKSESSARGGCPADWVWIVPPISGGATKVFHQEMMLYYLSPSYEYQEPAYKHYVLPGEVPRLNPPRSFKAVASMIMDANMMMRTVKERRIKCTILYATETGMSKNYANVVKDLFDRNFNCSLYCMEEYDRAKLEHEQLVLVVTSTFGSGDPPANGETFGQYLMDLRSGRVGTGFQPAVRRGRVSAVVRPTMEQLAKAREDMTHRLAQVKFGVFGLGSRAYPNFCAFAHTVDNLLMTLGAEQVYQCGEGDELCGQEESFQGWLNECYLKSCETYRLAPRLGEKGGDSVKMHKKTNFRIKPYRDAAPPNNICRDLSHVHKKNVISARMKSRTKLQSPNSDRSTIQIALQPSSRMPYQPGDHLTIYPQNNSYLVNELLERINLNCDPDEPIYVESEMLSDSGESSWSMERRLPVPTTIRQAFTNFLDITTPPTPQMLQRFRKMTTRKYDQDVLDQLASGGEKYEDWKYDRYPNLPEVLNQFHSLKLDAAHLIMTLPLLQCRYYSISSSPKMHPNEIHITVAVVTFRKRGGSGPRHLGVSSTWLNKLETNAIVPCVVRTANGFHMPDQAQAPIIMVGPGTGIAPFRGFWQERMYNRSEELKKQLLTKKVTPRTAPVHIRGHAIPNTPANRLSIGSMGGPGGPGQRRHFVSTVTAPTKSMLEVELDRRQAPVSDLSDTDSDSIDGESNDSEEEDRKRKQEKQKDDKKKRKLSNRLRRSASDESQLKNIAEMVSVRDNRWGTMSLYFGCRRSDTDYIYKDEIKRAQLTGAITDVNMALSREPGVQKTYVQDLLKKNADSIVQKLMVERGYFYVCGDVSMAADVGRTLQNIFEENGAMSANEARQLIENMKDNGQYREDIFGVTLKTAEVTNRVRTAAKRAWRVLVTASDNNPMTPMSSRPPLTPTTPGFGGDSYRPFNKRPTVTVLSPTPGVPNKSATLSGSRLTSQPHLSYTSTNNLLTPSSTCIIEEPANNGGFSLTEYEATDSAMEILNPKSSSQENSFISSENPSSDHKTRTEHDVVIRRHNSEDATSRRAIRKIKSQSQVETDI